MPIEKTFIKSVSTMRQVAQIVGMPYGQFWRWVREQKIIDEPKHRIGRRTYYDPDGVNRVVKQVEKKREEGQI